MKKYQSHLYAFSKAIVDYIPTESSLNTKSYMLILICIYTGIPIVKLINSSSFSGEKIWVSIAVGSGECYTISISIPSEIFILCKTKNIDYLSCVKKTVGLRDVVSVMDKVAVGVGRKIFLEELQTIFKIMCESSPVTFRAYKLRVGIFERESGLKFIPCDSKKDEALKFISLVKLTKKQDFLTPS